MKKLLIVTSVFAVILVGLLWLTSIALTPTPLGPAKAPIPHLHKDAVIQVYGADVWGFRGNFAIHTWVATKARDAEMYQIYQVIGWRLRRRGSAVSIETGMPDRPWFRSPPILLYELRGEPAQRLIPRVHQAVIDYPYAQTYTMWPGPNSNSFTQWIAEEVPELELELPTKAIGKSWMTENYPATR